MDACLGFIMNSNSSKVFWKARHWYALRQINGIWWNLDSKFKEPLSIVNIVDYLRSSMQASSLEKRAFLYIVTTQEQEDRVYKTVIPCSQGGTSVKATAEDLEIKSLIEASEKVSI